MLNLNGKLPHVVLATIALQTAGAIWWAASFSSTVTANLKSQGEAIQELKLGVAALTAARVVLLEAEVSRLRVELAAYRKSK